MSRLGGMPSKRTVANEAARLRKRQGEEPLLLDKDQASSAKKKKTEPTNRHPPAFWDSLSTIHLTRRALQEVERRTNERRSQQVPEARVLPLGRRVLRSDTRRLTQLASQGGLDLRGLRGYSNIPAKPATMSQSSSSSRKEAFPKAGSSEAVSSKTGKTKTTGPYSANFQQLMKDRGVYPVSYRPQDGSNRPKPANIEDIRERLARHRPSLSPPVFSESEFETFQNRNLWGGSEAQLMSDVIPTMAGSKDDQFNSAADVPFNNLEKFDPSVTVPQPDKYYGASASQIDLRVRRDLGSYITPSRRTGLPAAPNFYLVGKGESDRLDVARRQAMYDGAVGARGMLQLQNYGKDTLQYDKNAYTISSVYFGGMLEMYATHPQPCATHLGGTEYYMTQLDTYGMTGNINSFRSGARAYRNGRDWAQEQRDRMISDANDVARKRSTDTRSSRRGNSNISSARAEDSSESEISMDELAPEYEPAKKRRRT